MLRISAVPRKVFLMERTLESDHSASLDLIWEALISEQGSLTVLPMLTVCALLRRVCVLVMELKIDRLSC